MSLTRRNVLIGGTGLLAAAGNAEQPGAQQAPTRLRGKKLLERGEPEVYSGGELAFIGMPVGGLFAGTVYLGGDGQLWNWDIFNQERLGCVERTNATFMGDSLNAMSGANYVDPVRQQSPFRQRFHLFVEGAAERAVRFGDVRFRGEYPVGKVEYAQADADVEMSLVAFSPFCPLDAENSSFPATTLSFEVRNVGSRPLTLRLVYGLDNPVLTYSRKERSEVRFTHRVTASNGVVFGARPLPPLGDPRPDVIFENWASGTYGDWVIAGTAFGDRPMRVSELPSYMGAVEAATEFVVNSHQTRNGEDVAAGDAHLGTLRSPPFEVCRRYVRLRVGGGAHKGATCVSLVCGEEVRSVTGADANKMRWMSIPVHDLEGKQAYLEVVDRVAGGWGNISLGEVLFSDLPAESEPLESLRDYGTFCVELIGGGTPPIASDERAEVGRKFELAPGGVESVTFVVAWHFANCARNLPGKRHWYASRWPDAAAVARDLVARWTVLRDTTLAWNRTWYDSTLPYWFLDRTFINTSILATTTCFRLDEGRYYFWEGVGCCPGTCTHVWGYAQAVGRVFPEVERYLRSEIDFKKAYRTETGAIDYRAEYHRTVATDGQAGCILRAYREHLMSPDRDFLRSVWPQVRGAVGYLIAQDPDKNGILIGAQYNTLDTAWYGEIAWISSLYIAALWAGEAMAVEVGDREFARECRSIAEQGARNLSVRLFNGEYFVNRVDPAHPEANNTNVGCHIDQLYGQAWAHQVGLPRVVSSSLAKTALKSLFKHNFFEDVWEYRRRNKAIPGGRWYAAPKEAGLIMCSFPKGGAEDAAGKSGDAWAVGYFNECMTGFEYQAAHHMISEGLVTEGLTVIRAIHERYHPSKRNPYNEVECSDHYGRAMASFGAFVSVAGFYCHGPSRTMSFAPKVGGARFRSAFINESGWGTYSAASGKASYRWREGQLLP